MGFTTQIQDYQLYMCLADQWNTFCDYIQLISDVLNATSLNLTSIKIFHSFPIINSTGGCWNTRECFTYLVSSRILRILYTEVIMAIGLSLIRHLVNVIRCIRDHIIIRSNPLHTSKDLLVSLNNVNYNTNFNKKILF
jgi:hypothetical protein